MIFPLGSCKLDIFEVQFIMLLGAIVICVVILQNDRENTLSCFVLLSLRLKVNSHLHSAELCTEAHGRAVSVNSWIIQGLSELGLGGGLPR